jgi:hypothetical protein
MVNSPPPFLRLNLISREYVIARVVLDTFVRQTASCNLTTTQAAYIAEGVVTDGGKYADNFVIIFNLF